MLVTAGATLALAEENAPQSGLPVTGVAIAGKCYVLEVAATPQQSERGLMYRTSLPVNGGMLFRFPETRPVAFWMKNTLIPLDMVFIQAGKVVHIAHQAQPCKQEPCPIYPSQKPVDMVIELPGGTARKHHIQAGATVKLTPLAQAGTGPMTSSVSNSKGL